MYVVLVIRLKISDGLFLITSLHSGFIRYSKSELNTYLINTSLLRWALDEGTQHPTQTLNEGNATKAGISATSSSEQNPSMMHHMLIIFVGDQQ